MYDYHQVNVFILSCLFLGRTKIHGKLMEAQEKVVSWLSAREQVYTKLGEWFV